MIFTYIWKNVSGTAIISSGSWNNLILTYDGSNVRNYINGSLDSTTPHTGTLGSMPLSCIGIGRGTSGGCNGSPIGSYLNGTVDKLRIYSKVLSVSEITAAYNAEK